MPTENTQLYTSLADLVNLGTRVKTVTDQCVKYVSVANGVISFFKTADGSGTAAYTVNIPEEMFLDQEHTSFVPSFAWSAASYPGSTNPNLDGKPVLVLALKTQPASGAAATISYQFIDVSHLVDTYTAADSTINVAGYTLAVKVSAAANNAITVQNDGLHVDVSGKIDKVTTAAEGNLMVFDAAGGAKDMGYRLATSTEVNTALDAIFPTA